MNWNQLEYVLTLAREKSITRAAQKLYLSQPSLSLSLKHLEEELGTTLFLRNGSGLELTYAGQLCYFPVAGVESSRPLCLVYPRSDYQSAPLKAMLDLFRQQLPVLYGLSSET